MFNLSSPENGSFVSRFYGGLILTYPLIFNQMNLFLQPFHPSSVLCRTVQHWKIIPNLVLPNILMCFPQYLAICFSLRQRNNGNKQRLESFNFTPPAFPFPFSIFSPIFSRQFTPKILQRLPRFFKIDNRSSLEEEGKKLGRNQVCG